MDTHGDKLAYRVDEAVKASGVGRTALYEAMAAGKLAYRKLGARTLILRADLERFLGGLVVG